MNGFNIYAGQTRIFGLAPETGVGTEGDPLSALPTVADASGTLNPTIVPVPPANAPPTPTDALFGCQVALAAGSTVAVGTVIPVVCSGINANDGTTFNSTFNVTVIAQPAPDDTQFGFSDIT